MLRYHGGKYRLAPWIISHFPRHRIYVEPFGGGGSVLMRKERAYAEVYNDLWGDVVNVFRVMRDPTTASELRRSLELTPFAREEFEAPWAEDAAPVERARRTIFRSLAGFGSASTNAQHSTGFRASSNRSHTTPAHDWASYPAYIPAFVERLQGVVIEQRPAAKVIAQHDSPDTLFYVDPPYPLSTRNTERGNAHYAHELQDDDHRALAKQLRGVKGMVVLSGYGCPLYDEELYPDWRRYTKQALADGANPRTEVLWLNEAAVCRLLGVRQQMEVAL